jgi:hypothetical protein
MLRVILGVLILTAAAFAAQTVEGHVVSSATGAGIAGACEPRLPIKRGA